MEQRRLAAALFEILCTKHFPKSSQESVGYTSASPCALLYKRFSLSFYLSDAPFYYPSSELLSALPLSLGEGVGG